MNLNEIQNVWNSPSNRPPDTGRERLARQFVRQMIRRRRFQSIWLIVTFAWLTLISVVALGNLVRGNLNPAVEWAVIPLLIAPWAFAIHFLRSYLKSSASCPSGGSPVAESFREALAATLSEQTHLKRVGALLAILVPILIIVLQQLQSAGKVTPREMACMAVFFGGALLAGGLGLAIRYFRRLVPRRRMLDNLLAELDDTGPLD